MPSSSGPGSGRTRRGASTRPAAGRSGGSRSGSGSAKRSPSTGSKSSSKASAPTTSAPKRDRNARGEATTPAGARRLPTWLSHRDVRTRRAIGAAVIFALLFVPLVSTLNAWWQQRQELESMRETIASQEARVRELQKEQTRWRDDAYVVQQARKRLKMVKVGETAYTVIDADPNAATDPSLATAPAPESHPWYGRMWESIEIADAPAAHS